MIDEDVTARLLRLAGRRPDVPADREARVRQAFLQEVRVASRVRTRRRMAALGVGLATAAALVLAVGTWPTRQPARATAVAATVERVEGDTTFAPGREVRVGDAIETGNARIALRLAGGASLRFDRGSRAQLVSRNRIQLDAGSLYVDSGTDDGLERGAPSTSPDIEIVTPLGLVTDIGTQFEVRVNGASLRVRVRSGIVHLTRGSELTVARPGIELMVTSTDTATRSVEAYSDEWAWAARLAPDFPIDGRSLSAFLEYLCREQGWTLVYTDPKLAFESSGMILSGPEQGVPLADALSIVLPTTGLTYRLHDGTLTIARGDQP